VRLARKRPCVGGGGEAGAGGVAGAVERIPRVAIADAAVAGGGGPQRGGRGRGGALAASQQGLQEVIAGGQGLA